MTTDTATENIRQDWPVTKPGVYDMPVEPYHRDPVAAGSLSCGGAKLLLPPSCPAKYKYWRDTGGTAPTKEMDLGTAAHACVLTGNTDALVIIDAEDWRTKAAQIARNDAHTAGLTPLLSKQYVQVQDMAEALYAHPLAAALLKPGTGKPEQSIFWRDAGTWRRARLDFMPSPGLSDSYMIPEYKSCKSADRDSISKVMWNLRYLMQAAWYIDAVIGIDHMAGGQHPVMVFIFQETEAPYLVQLAQLSQYALEWGRKLNNRALSIYQECVTTGRWPGYSENVTLINLPAYAEYALADAQEAGDFE